MGARFRSEIPISVEHMFDATGKPRKPQARAQARVLRSQGWSYKRIAAELGVSPSSALNWTRDIELTPDQVALNLGKGTAAARELVRQRAERWSEVCRERRRRANSDTEMVRFFARFVRGTFVTPPEDFTLLLNVYLGNGLLIEDVEKHWLTALELPQTCLRGHSINHFPTSSSGLRPRRLPYGVCTLRVLRSTALVQHIFGAIQEYAGFEEPRWLE